MTVVRFVCGSASLASLTRETGPKIVRGDPEKKAEAHKGTVLDHHHFGEPILNLSDSALKFTHILYNLSPAGNISKPSIFSDEHERF